MAGRARRRRRQTTLPPSPGAAPGIGRRERRKLEQTNRLPLRLPNPAPSLGKFAARSRVVKLRSVSARPFHRLLKQQLVRSPKKAGDAHDLLFEKPVKRLSE